MATTTAPPQTPIVKAPGHTGRLTSGSSHGPLVWWTECTCGWIGRATTDPDYAWDPHRQHLAGDLR